MEELVCGLDDPDWASDVSAEDERMSDLLHHAARNSLQPVWPRPGGRHIFDGKGKVLSACRLEGGMLRNVAV